MCSMEPAISTTPAVEVWKDIEGFEGLYEVSDQGRVRSLDRMTERIRSDGSSHMMRVKGKIKIPHERNGYLYVDLYIGHKRAKCVDLHIIVAKAFVPNPQNLPEVNHKDENKHNNLPCNLEWCDHKYNINYATGKWRKAIPRRKRVEQLTLDGRHVAFYESVCKITRLKGYSQGNISGVCRGETHTAYGYRWRYV